VGGIVASTSGDTKVLNAYSSVTHINLLLYGLTIYRIFYLNGSIFISIRHGYIATLLFYIVGIIYQEGGRRILLTSTGLRNFHGFLVFLTRIVFLINIGIPPFVAF
jgi:NADH-quinone oxidoreductase subunit M